jgi:hypothetical protein
VSALALSSPAEAKIVYTPAHHIIREHTSYQLDLNRDKKIDFTITNSVSCTDVCNYSLFQVPAKGNDEIGYYRGSARILEGSALRRGTRIGPSAKFHNGRARMLLVIEGCVSTICYVSGPWANVQHRYLGLRFKINGQTHYGWARLSAEISELKIVPTLTGYAYETIPNKSIIAGATKGPDDISVEEPDATVTMPTRGPATLGVFALGSPGLPIWRREESALGER